MENRGFSFTLHKELATLLADILVKFSCTATFIGELQLKIKIPCGPKHVKFQWKHDTGFRSMELVFHTESPLKISYVFASGNSIV